MDVTNRDRLNVLQTMFAVIREAHEYANIRDDRDYYHFIDGVLAMTETLLKEIDERPAGEPEPDSYTPDKSELGRCIPVNIEGLTVSTSRDNVGMYNTYMNGKLD